MNIFKKVIGHFKTICVHKFWVFYYCCKLGIPIRGILHDLSKFHPIEFFEGVKYFSGTSSPIDAAKLANGWSKAWMHHKSHNLHHYCYWQDNFDRGGRPLIMPYKYQLEMLADYLGAGRAYTGNNFTYSGEYKWWENKTQLPLAMHPVNKLFIEEALNLFNYHNGIPKEVHCLVPSSEPKLKLKVWLRSTYDNLKYLYGCDGHCYNYIRRYI